MCSMRRPILLTVSAIMAMHTESKILITEAIVIFIVYHFNTIFRHPEIRANMLI